MRKLLLAMALTGLGWGQAPVVRGKPKLPALAREAPLVPLTERERAVQMLDRFTFGARPGDVERVLALGPDDDWALVGSPNHKTLWVLARKPALPDDVMAQVKAKATAQGFDAAKLVTQRQGR